MPIKLADLLTKFFACSLMENKLKCNKTTTLMLLEFYKGHSPHPPPPPSGPNEAQKQN